MSIAEAPNTHVVEAPPMTQCLCSGTATRLTCNSSKQHNETSVGPQGGSTSVEKESSPPAAAVTRCTSSEISGPVRELDGEGKEELKICGADRDCNPTLVPFGLTPTSVVSSKNTTLHEESMGIPASHLPNHYLSMTNGPLPAETRKEPNVACRSSIHEVHHEQENMPAMIRVTQGNTECSSSATTMQANNYSINGSHTNHLTTSVADHTATTTTTASSTAPIHGLSSPTPGGPDPAVRQAPVLPLRSRDSFGIQECISITCSSTVSSAQASMHTSGSSLSFLQHHHHPGESTARVNTSHDGNVMPSGSTPYLLNPFNSSVRAEKSTTTPNVSSTNGNGLYNGGLPCGTSDASAIANTIPQGSAKALLLSPDLSSTISGSSRSRSSRSSSRSSSGGGSAKEEVGGGDSPARMLSPAMTNKPGELQALSLDHSNSEWLTTSPGAGAPDARGVHRQRRKHESAAVLASEPPMGNDASDSGVTPVSTPPSQSANTVNGSGNKTASPHGSSGKSPLGSSRSSTSVGGGGFHYRGNVSQTSVHRPKFGLYGTIGTTSPLNTSPSPSSLTAGAALPPPPSASHGATQEHGHHHHHHRHRSAHHHHHHNTSAGDHTVGVAAPTPQVERPETTTTRADSSHTHAEGRGRSPSTSVHAEGGGSRLGSVVRISVGSLSPSRRMSSPPQVGSSTGAAPASGVVHDMDVNVNGNNSGVEHSLNSTSPVHSISMLGIPQPITSPAQCSTPMASVVLRNGGGGGASLTSPIAIIHQMATRGSHTSCSTSDNPLGVSGASAGFGNNNNNNNSNHTSSSGMVAAHSLVNSSVTVGSHAPTASILTPTGGGYMLSQFPYTGSLDDFGFSSCSGAAGHFHASSGMGADGSSVTGQHLGRRIRVEFTGDVDFTMESRGGKLPTFIQGGSSSTSTTRVPHTGMMDGIFGNSLGADAGKSSSQQRMGFGASMVSSRLGTSKLFYNPCSVCKRDLDDYESVYRCEECNYMECNICHPLTREVKDEIKKEIKLRHRRIRQLQRGSSGSGEARQRRSSREPSTRGSTDMEEWQRNDQGDSAELRASTPGSSSDSSTSSSSSSSFGGARAHVHKLKPFKWRVTATDVQKTIVSNKAVNSDGNKIINDYVVVKLLGRGSYATVKLVQHIHNGGLFALKIMKKFKKNTRGIGGHLNNARRSLSLTTNTDPSSSDQQMHDDLLREIAVMKLVDHPNIVKLREVIDDVEEEKIYIIMEYCEGGPVHVLGNPPLSVESVRAYGFQLASALLYLHSEFLYHRDVKPANVLVAQGVAKLVDFGTCNSRIRTNMTDGTPAYSCPEQVRGEEVSGDVVDSWAFAVTLFQMAYGQLPFPSNLNAFTLRQFLLKEDPLTIPPYPADPSLPKLLEQMLCKDLSNRLLLCAAADHDFFLINGNVEFPTALFKNSINNSSLSFWGALGLGSVTGLNPAASLRDRAIGVVKSGRNLKGALYGVHNKVQRRGSNNGMGALANRSVLVDRAGVPIPGAVAATGTMEGVGGSLPEVDGTLLGSPSSMAGPAIHVTSTMSPLGYGGQGTTGNFTSPTGTEVVNTVSQREIIHGLPLPPSCDVSMLSLFDYMNAQGSYPEDESVALEEEEEEQSRDVIGGVHLLRTPPSSSSGGGAESSSSRNIHGHIDADPLHQQDVPFSSSPPLVDARTVPSRDHADVSPPTVRSSSTGSESKGGGDDDDDDDEGGAGVGMRLRPHGSCSTVSSQDTHLASPPPPRGSHRAHPPRPPPPTTTLQQQQQEHTVSATPLSRAGLAIVTALNTGDGVNPMMEMSNNDCSPTLAYLNVSSTTALWSSATGAEGTNTRAFQLNSNGSITVSQQNSVGNLTTGTTFGGGSFRLHHEDAPPAIMSKIVGNNVNDTDGISYQASANGSDRAKAMEDNNRGQPVWPASVSKVEMKMADSDTPENTTPNPLSRMNSSSSRENSASLEDGIGIRGSGIRRPTQKPTGLTKIRTGTPLAIDTSTVTQGDGFLPDFISPRLPSANPPSTTASKTLTDEEDGMRGSEQLGAMPRIVRGTEEVRSGSSGTASRNGTAVAAGEGGRGGGEEAVEVDPLRMEGDGDEDQGPPLCLHRSQGSGSQFETGLGQKSREMNSSSSNSNSHSHSSLMHHHVKGTGGNGDHQLTTLATNTEKGNLLIAGPQLPAIRPTGRPPLGSGREKTTSPLTGVQSPGPSRPCDAKSWKMMHSQSKEDDNEVLEQSQLSSRSASQPVVQKSSPTQRRPLLPPSRRFSGKLSPLSATSAERSNAISFETNHDTWTDTTPSDAGVQQKQLSHLNKAPQSEEAVKDSGHTSSSVNGGGPLSASSAVGPLSSSFGQKSTGANSTVEGPTRGVAPSITAPTSTEVESTTSHPLSVLPTSTAVVPPNELVSSSRRATCHSVGPDEVFTKSVGKMGEIAHPRTHSSPSPSMGAGDFTLRLGDANAATARSLVKEDQMPPPTPRLTSDSLPPTDIEERANATVTTTPTTVSEGSSSEVSSSQSPSRTTTNPNTIIPLVSDVNAFTTVSEKPSVPTPLIREVTQLPMNPSRLHSSWSTSTNLAERFHAPPERRSTGKEDITEDSGTAFPFPTTSTSGSSTGIRVYSSTPTTSNECVISTPLQQEATLSGALPHTTSIGIGKPPSGNHPPAMTTPMNQGGEPAEEQNSTVDGGILDSGSGVAIQGIPPRRPASPLTFPSPPREPRTPSGRRLPAATPPPLFSPEPAFETEAENKAVSGPQAAPIPQTTSSLKAKAKAYSSPDSVGHRASFSRDTSPSLPQSAAPAAAAPATTSTGNRRRLSVRTINADEQIWLGVMSTVQRHGGTSSPAFPVKASASHRISQTGTARVAHVSSLHSVSPHNSNPKSFATVGTVGSLNAHKPVLHENSNDAISSEQGSSTHHFVPSTMAPFTQGASATASVGSHSTEAPTLSPNATSESAKVRLVAQRRRLRQVSTQLNTLAVNLEHMDLSYNALSLIAPGLKPRSFVSLTTLLLHHNQFRQFPAALLNMPNLVTLDLSFNLIECIPEAPLVAAKSLEELLLRHNRIREVGVDPVSGDSILSCGSLRLVDLSENPLEHLPPNLVRSKKLQLVLDTNPVIQRQWEDLLVQNVSKPTSNQGGMFLSALGDLRNSISDQVLFLNPAGGGGGFGAGQISALAGGFIPSPITGEGARFSFSTSSWISPPFMTDNHANNNSISATGAGQSPCSGQMAGASNTTTAIRQTVGGATMEEGRCPRNGSVVYLSPRGEENLMWGHSSTTSNRIQENLQETQRPVGHTSSGNNNVCGGGGGGGGLISITGYPVGATGSVLTEAYQNAPQNAFTPSPVLVVILWRKVLPMCIFIHRPSRPSQMNTAAGASMNAPLTTGVSAPGASSTLFHPLHPPPASTSSSNMTGMRASASGGMAGAGDTGGSLPYITARAELAAECSNNTPAVATSAHSHVAVLPGHAVQLLHNTSTSTSTLSMEPHPPAQQWNEGHSRHGASIPGARTSTLPTHAMGSGSVSRTQDHPIASQREGTEHPESEACRNDQGHSPSATSELPSHQHVFSPASLSSQSVPVDEASPSSSTTGPVPLGRMNPHGSLSHPFSFSQAWSSGSQVTPGTAVAAAVSQATVPACGSVWVGHRSLLLYRSAALKSCKIRNVILLQQQHPLFPMGSFTSRDLGQYLTTKKAAVDAAGGSALLPPLPPIVGRTARAVVRKYFFINASQLCPPSAEDGGTSAVTVSLSTHRRPSLLGEPDGGDGGGGGGGDENRSGTSPSAATATATTMTTSGSPQSSHEHNTPTVGTTGSASANSGVEHRIALRKFIRHALLQHRKCGLGLFLNTKDLSVVDPRIAWGESMTTANAQHLPYVKSVLSATGPQLLPWMAASSVTGMLLGSMTGGSPILSGASGIPSMQYHYMGGAAGGSVSMYPNLHAPQSSLLRQDDGSFLRPSAGLNLNDMSFQSVSSSSSSSSFFSPSSCRTSPSVSSVSSTILSEGGSKSLEPFNASHNHNHHHHTNNNNNNNISDPIHLPAYYKTSLPNNSGSLPPSSGRGPSLDGGRRGTEGSEVSPPQTALNTVPGSLYNSVSSPLPPPPPPPSAPAIATSFSEQEEPQQQQQMNKTVAIVPMASGAVPVTSPATAAAAFCRGAQFLLPDEVADPVLNSKGRNTPPPHHTPVEPALTPMPPPPPPTTTSPSGTHSLVLPPNSTTGTATTGSVNHSDVTWLDSGNHQHHQSYPQPVSVEASGSGSGNGSGMAGGGGLGSLTTMPMLTIAYSQGNPTLTSGGGGCAPSQQVVSEVVLRMIHHILHDCVGEEQAKKTVEMAKGLFLMS